MERIEEQTTLVQGVLLVVGAVFFLSEGFGLSSLAGQDPTTLGVAIYGLAFVVAAAGSLVVGKRRQAALQVTAAIGFTVVLVGTLADLGLAVSALGAALVLAPVLVQAYLRTARMGDRPEPTESDETSEPNETKSDDDAGADG
ncbi:hypothetical protein [Halomarina litorea]|uniref:hypothetical protein n=1 Tax=Halomarina litorea TaxID=2961595 RepID=UPI0020C29A3F|nr:hypothetical protein [Halomarina sp. BCD28]